MCQFETWDCSTPIAWEPCLCKRPRLVLQYTTSDYQVLGSLGSSVLYRDVTGTLLGRFQGMWGPPHQKTDHLQAVPARDRMATNWCSWRVICRYDGTLGFSSYLVYRVVYLM